MSELKLLKYELDEHKHYRVIVNGLKFKNEDMYDFLVQFKTLDKSKSIRQKLIKNGFNDYKKKYSENIIINKYLSFFKKVLQ